MRLFIIIALGILHNSMYAQSAITITYDASGNRTAKQVQGSSPNPTVTASSQAVTPGQPVTLTTSGCPGVVQWSTGQQGVSITANPTATTQYTALCQVPGCTSGEGKVTVEVIQCGNEEITVSASATVVRYGQPVTLTAFGCTGVVQWSTGDVGSIALVNVYGPVTQFTATCTKAYCENIGSSSVYIGGTTGCAAGDVLVSLKSGNWNDPSVWSCGRIPTQNDEVYLADGHAISVNVTGYAKLLIQGGGWLVYPSSDPVYTIVFPAY